MRVSVRNQAAVLVVVPEALALEGRQRVRQRPHRPRPHCDLRCEGERVLVFTRAVVRKESQSTERKSVRGKKVSPARLIRAIPDPKQYLQKCYQGTRVRAFDRGSLLIDKSLFVWPAH